MVHKDAEKVKKGIDTRGKVCYFNTERCRRQ